MNKILFFCGVLTLLTTAGCLVRDDRRPDPYWGHARYERPPEVIVPDPGVVVRPPEIIVR
jgi:hypothetical protein